MLTFLITPLFAVLSLTSPAFADPPAICDGRLLTLLRTSPMTDEPILKLELKAEGLFATDNQRRRLHLSPDHAVSIAFQAWRRVDIVVRNFLKTAVARNTIGLIDGNGRFEAALEFDFEPDGARVYRVNALPDDELDFLIGIMNRVTIKRDPTVQITTPQLVQARAILQLKVDRILRRAGVDSSLAAAFKFAGDHQ